MPLLNGNNKEELQRLRRRQKINRLHRICLNCRGIEYNILKTSLDPLNALWVEELCGFCLTQIPTYEARPRLYRTPTYYDINGYIIPKI